MKPNELLERSPSLDILDPTKLRDSICLRYFFFKHILGWRSVRPNVHLTFGKAIHEARRFMLEQPGRYNKETVDGAYEVFLRDYRKDFSDELDDENHPKSPLSARRVLELYARRYADQDEGRRIVAAEEVGAIQLGDGLVLTVKLDTLLASPTGEYEVVECKSTSRQTKGWADAWHTSLQVWSYIAYAQAKALREKTSCIGATIDGLILHKHEVDVVRLSVPLVDGKLLLWREAVRTKLDRIWEQVGRFKEDSEEAPVMFSWPQEGEECNRYRLCEFFHYCLAWPNPLRRCEECPTEFKVDYWDPRREDDEQPDSKE